MSDRNGRLGVTYRDFEEWGVPRHKIASAIRELEALGFIEVTERGRGGKPNRYRMTYLPSPSAPNGTHDYLRFNTPEEAQAALAEAHKTRTA
jgi:hypothetical protein